MGGLSEETVREAVPVTSNAKDWANSWALRRDEAVFLEMGIPWGNVRERLELEGEFCRGLPPNVADLVRLSDLEGAEGEVLAI